MLVSAVSGFAPQPFASIAGVITIIFQGVLIVSGNLSWLNWLTVILAIPLISDKWLAANGYPVSSHAGIPDTSEMMYLGGDKGWTRPAELPNAVGDPVRQRGAAADPNAKRVNNGISGDARR